MTPHRTRLLLCLLPAAFCLLLPACAQKGKTDVGKQAKPTPDNSQLAQMDVNDRVKSIEGSVGNFDRIVSELPGSGGTPRDRDAANRQLMRKAFEELAQLLPMLEGPNQTGDFRQGLRVLDASRQQLANGSMDLAAEPTIAQGVRATAHLLASLNRFVFNNDPGLTQKIDAMQKIVNELDVTHGARSRVISAEAMHQAAGVLHAMSDNLSARLGPATTQPGGAATTQTAK
jgi:hypothetical protein